MRYNNKKEKVMKKLLIFCALFFCGFWAHGQIITKDTVFTGKDMSWLDSWADEFSQTVTKQLRMNYPSCVDNVTVRTYAKDGAISLRYEARVNECPQEYADFTLERSGLASSGKNMLATQKRTLKRVHRNSYLKKEKLCRIYGSDKIRAHMTSDRIQISNGEWMVMIEKFFIVRRFSVAL